MAKKFVILFLGLMVMSLFGATPTTPLPMVDLTLNSPQQPAQLVKSLNVLLVLTLLVLAPSLVLVMTSFTRLIIVFSFLRQALGTQQMPPTQVLVTLSLVLTFFIMDPAIKKGYEEGIKPYQEERIGYDEAIEKTMKPFKEFMVRNTREKDLALFLRIRNLPNPKTVDELSLSVVLPAFMISELKTAFEIGFLLYLPFLVIDMVVSSILMALGMMMLPPASVSLPFKILIFVLVDGWGLIVQGMISSFK